MSIFETVYIVDDFYETPDLVRNYALNLEKDERSYGNYAGVMTKKPFLTLEHLEIFKQLVGYAVTQTTDLTGQFRFTKFGDKYKQEIHFDPGNNNCAWAGVVYLTPNIEDIDGTIFWKHKRTQLESIPRTLNGIQECGWNGVDDLKLFLETEGVDHSYWEKKMVVPYKYNRLVLFRPWRFHSAGPSFGDTFESCRLIQTFFWTPV